MQLSTVDHNSENLHMLQWIVRPQIHFWSDYKCSFCCFISCFTILYSNVIRTIEWFPIRLVTMVHMWYTICKMWAELSTVCDLGLLQSQFSISNNSIGYTEPYRKRCRLQMQWNRIKILQIAYHQCFRYIFVEGFFFIG